MHTKTLYFLKLKSSVKEMCFSAQQMYTQYVNYALQEIVSDSLQ